MKTKSKKSVSKSVITSEMIQWMESLKPYKEFTNKDYYDGYKNGMVEGAKAAIHKYSGDNQKLINEMAAFLQISLTHMKLWDTDKNANPELRQGIEHLLKQTK